MQQVRENEPRFALLNDPVTADCNRYGLAIDLIARTGLPEGRSMDVNGEAFVGSNPNRNKQHAFHFTADNCIGCHACEAACSEKNDLPPHLSFRSVGYVEGGSFPDYQRMNISMACNHCDDPVCLKGCPTRAYTKHAEFGAVLQDPETCFGCGYCTWVCPYNAPQLDPVKGRVEKCNMCVDRLEVGLKPACVSACLGNALNFGVVENVPEFREQAKISIPGFPDPSITQPNIRFQQTKQLPDEMGRTDVAPVKYRKDEDGQYRPVIDQKRGKEKHWNLGRLPSRENPLVIFTLSTQAGLGVFLLSFLGAQFGIAPLVSFANSDAYLLAVFAAAALAGLGLFMSTVHLGKPFRFYRGFNNLRWSPVSREGLGVVMFMAFAGLHGLAMAPRNHVAQSLLSWIGFDISAFSFPTIATALGALAVPAGLTGLYYMYRCYRIPARPFWNHGHTGCTFVGTMLNLGALLVTAIAVPAAIIAGTNFDSLVALTASVSLAGIAIESLGLIWHARTLNHANNEGGASHYVQSTTFGKTYVLRNVLLAAGALLMLTVATLPLITPLLLTLFISAALISVFTSFVGRALFYVLVIPTTMPGAFFWRNKGFEEHARDIGLAHMPQVGVVPDAH